MEPLVDYTLSDLNFPLVGKFNDSVPMEDDASDEASDIDHIAEHLDSLPISESSVDSGLDCYSPEMPPVGSNNSPARGSSKRRSPRVPKKSDKYEIKPEEKKAKKRKNIAKRRSNNNNKSSKTNKPPTVKKDYRHLLSDYNGPFSREQLLVPDLYELRKTVAEYIKAGKLKKSDGDLVRGLRRQLQNQQFAAERRLREKAEIAELQATNDELRDTVEELETENSDLRQRILLLEANLALSPDANLALSPDANLALSPNLVLSPELF